MSNLTYKIKHSLDITEHLFKAKQIAEFAIKTKSLSSKDVKHFGLKSIISNQILRKYSKNKKCKQVKSVKLTIPNQGIKFKNQNIWIPSLALNLPFQINVVKVNQIELDNHYAYVCCTVLDQPTQEEIGYIGVDRNATGHIAVASLDNKIIKLGKQAPHINRKYKKIRAKTQKKKSFKFIKKLKNKESRKVKDINHKISRKIVDLAKENNYAIKLEKLTGIRKKKQGRKLNGIKSNWSFYQLEQFIEYKAKLLGIKIFYVDPAYTSQNCSKCGLIGTRDKKKFVCSCGHKDHADANASFNIAKASIMQDRSTIDRDMVESQSDMAQVEITKTGLTIEPPTL
jgi:putative transposase